MASLGQSEIFGAVSFPNIATHSVLVEGSFLGCLDRHDARAFVISLLGPVPEHIAVFRLVTQKVD